MIKIVKNQEPVNWIAYRKTDGVDFQAIPGLRKSLLEEQGYICAYCMRRIPVRDRGENAKSKIEHILSQDNHDKKILDYKNLVVCCPGRIEFSSSHCDKKKGSADISFNLFDDAFFTTISYSSKEGTISSSNPQYDDEINNQLNLNYPLLKENRLRVLKAVQSMIKNKNWSTRMQNQQLQRWNNKDTNGKNKEYCGIVIWYLTKKLKHIK